MERVVMIQIDANHENIDQQRKLPVFYRIFGPNYSVQLQKYV